MTGDGWPIPDVALFRRCRSLFPPSANTKHTTESSIDFDLGIAVDVTRDPAQQV